MQTVGILLGIDQREGGVVIQAARQWQLDNVTGASGVGVQVGDNLCKLILGGCIGQFHLDRGDADLGTIPVLTRHV